MSTPKADPWWRATHRAVSNHFDAHPLLKRTSSGGDRRYCQYTSRVGFAAPITEGTLWGPPDAAGTVFPLGLRPLLYGERFRYRRVPKLHVYHHPHAPVVCVLGPPSVDYAPDEMVRLWSLVDVVNALWVSDSGVRDRFYAWTASIPHATLRRVLRDASRAPLVWELGGAHRAEAAYTVLLAAGVPLPPWSRP